MKKEEKIKQGKTNRAAGKRFELKVRQDLENKGWIVSKWANNVTFTCLINANNMQALIDSKGNLIPAKAQYNPFFKRIVGEGSGFPDFIVYRPFYVNIETQIGKTQVLRYDIIGVECKVNGKLDKSEKSKCKWLLDNKIFSEIIIAQKGIYRGEINYEKFKET